MEFIAFENGTIRDPRYRDEVVAPANRIAKKIRLSAEPTVARNRLHALSTKQRQLPEGKRPFACNPKEVVFRDFDLGSTYSIDVKLTNVSNGFNCFRITPISPEFSDMISIDYVLPSRIAAGLSWTVKIKFTPVKNEDKTTRFQVTTESGFFYIPIRTLKKRAVVTVDCSEVDFGTLTLGDSKKKAITLYNNGASVGSVYISGSFKKIAEKMHVDPVTKQEFPYLVMNPLMFRIDIPAFSKFQFELIFAPFEEVDFQCTIIFSDRNESNDSDFICTVRGKATSLPVHVSSLELNFSWCFYECTYCGEVSILNSSNITAIVEPDIPKELQHIIRFEPKMVCIQPCTELNILAYFTPRAFLEKDFSAFIDFHVKGQTLPATVKIIASLTSREPSVSTMRVDLGAAFVNSEAVETVAVTNESELPQMVGFPRLPENISVYPQTLTILPKENFKFKICVVPPHVGKFSQQLVLVNEYGDKKSIEVTGSGIQPALKFSESTIFLEPCCLDSSVSASTVVRNTTSEYRQFSFQVPGDYIRVSPSSGALRPDQSLPIVIFFIAPPEFISVAVEAPPPTTQKQIKGKKSSKGESKLHGHLRQEHPVETEAPKVSSYVDWEDSGFEWSKHKTVLLQCISKAAADNSEETCFIKLHCTAIKASVVGRTLLALKSNVAEAPLEKKGAKVVKKNEPAVAVTPIDMIEVSPSKCTLFLDFGEVTLNRNSRKTCFLKASELEVTYFQLRPVDLVSPFTIVRYPDHALQPGEEDIVIVEFQPSEYGAYSDVITFSSSTGNDVDVFLSGACCCTNLIVTTDSNMDVNNPHEPITFASLAPTLRNQTTQLPMYFYNLGAFALDVSLEINTKSDWRTKRTFVLHPAKFIVPPKGKVLSHCLFTPEQEEFYRQEVFVKAGGFEHKLEVEGRGCEKSVYISAPPSQSNASAFETKALAREPLPFCGKSWDYPYHLYFSKGEVKQFTFGTIKGGPVAECIVDQWSDVNTAAGWTVDSMKVPIPSGGTGSIGIKLKSSKDSITVPYCRFCINVRCPSDVDNETTLYICCTGKC